jgi:hypothetical protein
VGSNGILECKFLSENADAVQRSQSVGPNPNPNAAESMVKNGHRTRPHLTNPNPNTAESMVKNADAVP